MKIKLEDTVNSLQEEIKKQLETSKAAQSAFETVQATLPKMDTIGLFQEEIRRQEEQSQNMLKTASFNSLQEEIKKQFQASLKRNYLLGKLLAQ